MGFVHAGLWLFGFARPFPFPAILGPPCLLDGK
jgi:hypothetical protein